MQTHSSTIDTQAAIWQRVLEFPGELSLSAARALLTLQFSEGDHQRMDELSRKARSGTLSEPEQAELDTFERLACLLSILHSEARQALKRKSKKAARR